MLTHQPENYRCPFCLVAQGFEGDSVYTKPADIIYQDSDITAFIASHWWPNNPGHVIVIPNAHIENLYQIPDVTLSKIHRFSKQVAHALKDTYRCDGVSVRQHNEPAGDQDIWHYHLHIFPRYHGDNLYENNTQKQLSQPSERIPYASKLKVWLNQVDL